MNKKMITKLQETQMASVKGGANDTCDNASCSSSCGHHSCDTAKKNASGFSTGG